MKITLLVSIFIFSITVFAHENHMDPPSQNNAVTNESDASVQITEVPQETDPLGYYSSTIYAVDSGKKIRFMKNPCFEQRGYNMHRVRGFSFENGTVKQFLANGTLSEDKNKYSSLGHFLQTQKVCQAQKKNMPTFNVNLFMSEVWL